MSDKNEKTKQENIEEDRQLEKSMNEAKALFSYDKTTGRIVTNHIDVTIESEKLRDIIQRLRNYYWDDYSLKLLYFVSTLSPQILKKNNLEVIPFNIFDGDNRKAGFNLIEDDLIRLIGNVPPKLNALHEEKKGKIIDYLDSGEEIYSDILAYIIKVVKPSGSTPQLEAKRLSNRLGELFSPLQAETTTRFDNLYDGATTLTKQLVGLLLKILDYSLAVEVQIITPNQDRNTKDKVESDVYTFTQVLDKFNKQASSGNTGIGDTMTVQHIDRKQGVGFQAMFVKFLQDREILDVVLKLQSTFITKTELNDAELHSHTINHIYAVTPLTIISQILIYLKENKLTASRERAIIWDEITGSHRVKPKSGYRNYPFDMVRQVSKSMLQLNYKYALLGRLYNSFEYREHFSYVTSIAILIFEKSNVYLGSIDEALRKQPANKKTKKLYDLPTVAGNYNREGVLDEDDRKRTEALMKFSAEDLQSNVVSGKERSKLSVYSYEDLSTWQVFVKDNSAKALLPIHYRNEKKINR